MLTELNIDRYSEDRDQIWIESPGKFTDLFCIEGRAQLIKQLGARLAIMSCDLINSKIWFPFGRHVRFQLSEDAAKI